MSRGGVEATENGATGGPEPDGRPGGGASPKRHPRIYERLRALLATAPATVLLNQLAEERPRFVNWLPVLFGLGVWAYFSCASEPTAAAAALPLLTGLVFAGLTQRGGLARLLAASLIIAGAGFANAKWRTERVAAPVLERTLRGVEVTGVLERTEPHAKRGERLTLRLLSVEDVAPDHLPYRARIRVMAAAPGIQPGDVIRLKATLSPPSAPALPGGYDFARAAYYERIGAVGYALKAPVKVTPDPPVDTGFAMRARAAVEDARQAIGEKIMAALPGERGALAVALITGERGAVSQETTDAYRDSGLVHILSISGLHMVIMAGAVFAILRLLLATVPALALTQPIKKWAAAGGAIAAILYYAISGGSAATLRATIMMVVIFLAMMLGRPAIAMRNVAIAAFLILAVYPESLLDVGFQMSFAAVAALVAAYEAVSGYIDRRGFAAGALGRGALFFGGILFSTLIAGLAVTPLSVYHFHAMQHYAPLANLIAIPVCNLLVMPAALATLVALPLGLEAAPLWVMGIGISVMDWTAKTVSALPGAVTRVPEVPASAFACALVGGLWLVLWQRRWRLLGIPLILIGLALAPTAERPDLLIGREGALVAVRDASGRLAARAERPSTFELKRWLEHEGDAREPKDLRKTTAFRCDPLGCVASASGITLAVSRHPGGAADDCARAGVLVLTGERPPRCDGPKLVFDRSSLRTSGTVALYRTAAGDFRSWTVADARGRRPWSMPPARRGSDYGSARQPKPDGASNTVAAKNDPVSATNDVARYAAPHALADALASAQDLRPEVEDDDAP